MALWIGIDDTDSNKGGCTTYVGYKIICQLIERGYDIIGYPRLVRLNPNIPWKTRGNGAVSFRVGRGKGRKILIGEIRGNKIFSYSSEENNQIDIDDIKALVEREIESFAFLSDENTNSGYVMTKEKPDRSLYETCVKGIAYLDDVIKILDSLGAIYRGYKNGRGLIGASAAVSWEPTDRTFEIITYRYREKWGTGRDVDKISVIEMDKTINSTFDNYDYDNDRVLITPNSPCPILFGIRGENPDDLVKAKDMIRSEDYEGWIIFETNQGTDDHIERKKIIDIKPYESVVVEGVIEKDPYTIKGGHVIFSVKDETSSIDCTAYEPTKNFRDIVRKLRVGDVVEVYGGVREEPFTINIEKIRIKKLVQIKKKVENPICDNCRIHMKSLGRDKGYRCRRCGAIKSEDEAKFEILERGLREGFYEVPPCARRHLSKPLKRFVS